VLIYPSLSFSGEERNVKSSRARKLANINRGMYTDTAELESRHRTGGWVQAQQKRLLGNKNTHRTTESGPNTFLLTCGNP